MKSVAGKIVEHLHDRRNCLRVLLLLFALLSGAFFRFYGIGYGLPHRYIPDEVTMMNAAMNYGHSIANREKPSYILNYPEAFGYTLAGVIGSEFVFGKLTGRYSNLEDFAFAYLHTPGRIFLTARLFSATISLLTILLVFLIVNYLYNPDVAVISALIVAFLHTLAEWAHWALPDSMMVFWSMLSLLFTVIGYRKRKIRFLYLSALLAGLAASTKYNGGLIIFSTVYAMAFIVFEEKRNLHWREKALPIILHCAGFALVSMAILVSTSPGWIHSTQEAMGFFSNELDAVEHGRMGGGVLTGIPIIAFFIKLIGFEGILGLVLIAGVVFSLFKPGSREILLLVSIIPTMIYLGTWENQELHYYSTVLPCAAILSATMIYRFSRMNNMLRYISLVVLGVSLIHVSWLTSNADTRYSNVDTRTVAREWIEDNISEGAVFGEYWNHYGPPLVFYEDLYRFRGYEERMSGSFMKMIDDYADSQIVYHFIPMYHEYDIPQVPAQFAENIQMDLEYQVKPFKTNWKSIEEMTAEGIDYIVLSSLLYERYAQQVEVTDLHSFLYNRDRTFFYQFLEGDRAGFEIVREWVPAMDQPGPRLLLVRLTGSGDLDQVNSIEE